MEKVLVTGAAGAIGIKTIKYLLSEGKYEITALDLRTKNNFKRLKKYRRRVNVIYGDINDNILMDALVKDQDFIIHLAGVMPPLADIKKDICDLVEYQGTENIIKAINYYNPDCYLIYASSTTIYGDVDKVNVRSDIKVSELDYYSKMKVKTEKLIAKRLKKYIIFRLPLVLTNPKYGTFMYNVKLNSYIEAITDNDAAYMFVRAINYKDKLNKKTYNVGGGDSVKDYYRNILAKVLEIYGINMKYIFNMMFMDKNFYSHIYEDSDKLNEILDFRSDSLASFYMRLKREVRGRYIRKFLAKPFILFLRKKEK